MGNQIRNTLYLNATTTPSEEDLCWHPLVYVGTWAGMQQERFEITASQTREMLENFEAGIPTNIGVPINEINHKHVDGALGYVRKARLDANGNFWGGIQWTERGKQLVDTGELPFLSAVFVHNGPGEDPWPTAHNFIRRVSLTDEPLFYTQPAIGAGVISASMYRPIEDTPDTPNGGQVAMTREEARAKITEAHGELTDEQWAAVTEGVAEDGFEKFVSEYAGHTFDAPADATPDASADPAPEPAAPAPPVIDFAALQAGIAAAIEAAIKPLADAVGAMQEPPATDPAVDELAGVAASMQGRLEAVERENAEHKRKEFAAEIAASMSGTDMTVAASAVELLTALKFDPSPETADALIEHVRANKGLAMHPTGQIAASMGAAPAEGQTDEEWFAAQPLPSFSRESIRTISARKGISLRAAFNEYIYPAS